MANVFGALNRFISRLDSEPGSQSKPGGGPSNNAYGFQVLRNNNRDLNLEPWFDFVIGINSRTIDSGDPNLLATEIRNCAGSTISLGIYSAKGQQIREIYASIPPDGSGLGCALQWVPLTVTEDVWHILDVMPNSPADIAGLLPYSDYVIGSPEWPLRGDAGLGELVEQFMDRPLRLFVYNNEYDVTRMVTITPAKTWGGDGALGCVLGHGALHRVPAPLNEPAQAPGETLFESSDNFQPPLVGAAPAGSLPPVSASAGQQQDFVVPANMQFAPTPPPPVSGGGTPVGGKSRKQRAHHVPAPPAGLDDYFAEGEQKSRELEGGGNTPKPNSTLPPPPKGGPPKATTPEPPAAAEG